MNLSNFPLIVRAGLLSLLLAIVGYFLSLFIADQLPSSILFSLGLLIGGCITPTLLAYAAPGQIKTTTVYVGNLPYRANEAVVRQLFAEYGQVLSVRLMKDKQTGKRRGFGFVEMPTQDAAKAIDALNENEFQQRTLKVREANERTSKHNEPESAQ